MGDRLPPGPYRILPGADGTRVPWYIIPFDKEGRCTGPQTRAHLLKSLRDEPPTDVYLFSHGWNNAWAEASARYEHFIDGYRKLRQAHGLQPNRPYRPLLVGIFWPSAILVMPWERGPRFAGTGTADDAKVEQERSEVDEIAERLAPEDVVDFYELAQLERPLTEDEARRLAEMLAPLYSVQDELGEPESPPDADELLEVWGRMPVVDPGPARDDDFGTVEGEIGEAQAAGIFGWWARDAIRATTVWMMKDRAGRVGARGVGPLLAEILGAGDAPVHAVGHSYGCKVVLSAICAQPLSRSVNSVLLLQPAVNYLCFAQDATGRGTPGGYRQALARVEQPILSTFSAMDSALSRFFHLAVRRKSDLGEQRIAGAPPSDYAALGGYGAGGCGSDCKEIAIEKPVAPYSLGAGAPEIYSVNGTSAISGHGDISNEATWWALYCQVAQG